MANNYGGAREGNGRKRNPFEIKAAQLLDEHVPEDEQILILKKLAEKALEGSFLHMQLYMAYRYGKPQDKLDITTNGKSLSDARGKILERIAKDQKSLGN